MSNLLRIKKYLGGSLSSAKTATNVCMVFASADCKILANCWSFDAASSSMIAMRSLVKYIRSTFSSIKSSVLRTYFVAISDSSSNVHTIISTRLLTSDFFQFFWSANIVKNNVIVTLCNPFLAHRGVISYQVNQIISRYRFISKKVS